MRSNRRGLGAGVSRSAVLLASAFLVLIGALALYLAPVTALPATSSVSPSDHAPFLAPAPLTTSRPTQRQPAYGQLPLVFEANQGQSDPQVKFLARGSGYGLFLTGSETVLALQHSGPNSVLRMRLRGASNAPLEGVEELPGKSNYFIGSDPAKWRRGITQFARVRQQNVYPGVDLVYYGKQGKLEYDFEVAPGADPKSIALQFQGTDRLALDAGGNLVLGESAGHLRLEAPRVYQRIGNEKREVPGRFVLSGRNQVAFEVGPYDRSQTLVIDPVFTYSTYLGGGQAETSPSIAVDSVLSAYVAGTTTSADFPIPSGSTPFQNCLNDPTHPATCGSGGVASDVFVAKFDPSGTILLFASYIGGTGNDVSAAVAVDASLSVIVAGRTASSDFPAVNALTGTATGNHAFVSKLDSSGESLLYSTYLAGNGIDAATGVAIDLKNKIYVIGTTTSTNFPTTAEAFQTTSRGNSQFFVSKIDPLTSGVASLPYSTYFGGGNPLNGMTLGGGIAVDKNGNVYITGGTNFLNTGSNASTDFPILNALQACLDTPVTPASCPTGVTATDAFVAKLNPAGAVGTQLIYSTYVGGAGNDVGNAIAIDTSGIAYLTGSTSSTDIPIPANTTPFQAQIDCPGTTSPNPCPTTDAYVAKLSSFSTGTTTTPTVTMLYFSYLGGSGNDIGLGIGVDTLSGARLTGSTASNNFNLSNPLSGQGTYRGGATDGFVARIDTISTTPVHFSSYLGGSGADRGTGIAVDASGATYVAGDTSSANFPVQNPFQAALDGTSDAFVTKLGGTVNLALAGTASPNPAGAGNAVSFKYTVTNNGDYTSGITFTDAITTGSSPSATGPSGTCAGTTTLTCPIGALSPAGTATVTVSLTPLEPGPFSNNATLSVAGSTFTTSASPAPTVNVSSYAMGVSPSTRSVVAGTAATYTVTVTPSGGNFPNSVTLSCSGQPTGVTCTVPNGATISNLKNGSPQSRTFVINTVARVTTTAQLTPGHGPFYAFWLPVSGIAFLGMGIGGTVSRKRRWFVGLGFGAAVAVLLLLPGCGSSSKTTTTTTGTPAGTYTITITASSGTFTSSQPVQLVVQ